MTTLNNVAVALGLAFAGCAAQPLNNDDLGSSEAQLQASVQAEQEVQRVLPFIWIDDPEGIGSSRVEQRRVILSAAQYERLLGHAPPDDVDFDAGEIVVLFDGGLKRTDGYEANVEGFEFTRGTLYITIAILSPGADCPVAQRITHPYALVKLQRPRPFGLRVRFVRNDKVIDCDPPSAPTCNGLLCPDGQHCERPTVPFPFLLPFPPHCVPDSEPDPEPEPEPTDQDPCDTVRCRAGTHCEALEEGALCLADAPFCGGIAGIQCPGDGYCVDNPDDDCDPENGGADCGGLCQCETLESCEDGYVWDNAPDVCTCVEVASEL